jgi:hypothetical protein
VLELIEQITYLLVARCLGGIRTVEGQSTRFIGDCASEARVFLPDQENLRRSRFDTHDDVCQMYEVVSDHVFPLLPRGVDSRMRKGTKALDALQGMGCETSRPENLHPHDPADRGVSHPCALSIPLKSDTQR